MPMLDLGFGQTKEIKLNLNLFKDVQVWMFSVRQFPAFNSIWEKAIFIFGCPTGNVVVSIFEAAYVHRSSNWW